MSVPKPLEVARGQNCEGGAILYYRPNIRRDFFMKLTHNFRNVIYQLGVTVFD